MTTYLSTDNLFERQHPKLVQRLVAAALEADRAQHWAILHPPHCAGVSAVDDGDSSSGSSSGSGSNSRSNSHSYRRECLDLNVRVMEVHDVEPGGALSDPQHFDGGSLVTLDVMLSSPRGGSSPASEEDSGDFDGGSFATPESDGSVTRHAFERGDLLVFPSHKYHYGAGDKWSPQCAGARAVEGGKQKLCASVFTALGPLPLLGCAEQGGDTAACFFSGCGSLVKEHQ